MVCVPFVLKATPLPNVCTPLSLAVNTYTPGTEAALSVLVNATDPRKPVETFPKGSSAVTVIVNGLPVVAVAGAAMLSVLAAAGLTAMELDCAWPDRQQ